MSSAINAVGERPHRVYSVDARVIASPIFKEWHQEMKVFGTRT
jgi:hypothetical protein